MPKKPDPIDIHVGARVKLRRTFLGMSQADLARALNLAYQTIQKNERGETRIPAGRLYRSSQILGVPLDFFFNELSDDDAAEKKHTSALQSEAGTDQLLQRETLELIRAYYCIRDKKSRKGIVNLVISLAEAAQVLGKLPR